MSNDSHPAPPSSPAGGPATPGSEADPVTLADVITVVVALRRASQSHERSLAMINEILKDEEEQKALEDPRLPQLQEAIEQLSELTGEDVLGKMIEELEDALELASKPVEETKAAPASSAAAPKSVARKAPAPAAKLRMGPDGKVLKA